MMFKEVVSVLAVLLAVVVLGILARDSPPVSRKRGQVMVYPRAAVVIGVVFSIGPALAIVGLAPLSENRNATALTNMALAFVMVVAPATWFFCETLRRKILISPVGIVLVERAGRRRLLRWQEVISVKHHAFLGCISVRSGDGRRLLISDLLSGQRVLAHELLQRVPRRALECGHYLGQLRGRE